MVGDIAATRHKARNSSTKCYLLELPGELRNRIYSCAAQEEPVIYFSRRIARSSGENIAAYGLEQRKPDFIGLTQTCRQLRQEYSPIYATQVKIHVHHTDLAEYMQIGFPLLGHDEEGKPFGSLFIDCTSDIIDVEDGNNYEPEADLRPLVLYCMKTPRLHVHCGDHGCTCGECILDWSGMEDGIEALFDVSAKPDLQRWVESDVSKIILEFETDIDIVMKEGKEEQWMFGVTAEDRAAWEKHMEVTGFAFPFKAVRFVEG